MNNPGICLMVILFAVGLPAAVVAKSGSEYIDMPDGTQLAVDIIVPDAVDAPVPAVLVMTRYGRATRFSTSGIDAINGLGFAVVLVDMRGSGASSGNRQVIFSSEERADIPAILDWISAQDWSNQKIITTGVSYDANLADLALISEHPNLNAVVSRYGDYDLYRHLIAPGGIPNRFLMDNWSEYVIAADRSTACLEDVLACADQPHLRPVDADNRLDALRRALLEHQLNWQPAEATRGYEYIDDVTPAGRWVSEGSPANQSDVLQGTTIPQQLWASWLDAATAESALIRFNLNTQAPITVYIGAWSHGGLALVDPWLSKQQREALQDMPQLETFGEFLSYVAKGKPLERAVWYYTMGTETWRQTPVWPPQGLQRTALYMGNNEGLLTTLNQGASNDVYEVNFDVTTGQSNRWYTQMGGGSVQYPERATMNELMQTYTSPPLHQPLEITGSPVLKLYMSSSSPDAAIYSYLEALSPDGTVTYITDGQLRLFNRAQPSGGVGDSESAWVNHSFLRKDARPMEPGLVEAITIQLLPTSVQLPAGYRIRLSLAGHDSDTFQRYPRDGRVQFTFEHSKEFPSQIVIPHAGDGPLESVDDALKLPAGQSGQVIEAPHSKPDS